MRKLSRVTRLISKLLLWPAAIAVLIMMILQTVNVISRPVYQPILGVEELIGYGMLLMICFGVAYTTVVKGHVRVDLLGSKFSQKTWAIVDSITSILSIVVFALISWQSAAYALDKLSVGEYTPILKLPLSPFIFCVSFGFAMLCLAILVELLNLIFRGEE